MSKKFSSIEKQARIKLKYLNAAHNVNDLRVPPGNNLELLKGDLKEFYSIRVNKQWRICFTWKDNAPCDVEIVDYH